MLKSLRLQNFRGYIDHHVDFKEVSVIVGMNNAGKSTLVDALRLLSITTQRFRGLNYVEPPNWSRLRPEQLGVIPSMQNININFHTIFNQYSPPPGVVSAEFTNGAKIKIFIGPNQIFALIFGTSGRPVQNRWLAQDIDIPGIAILPQIGPVQDGEVILTRQTVQRNILSNRFSAQFRNQVFYNPDNFNAFRELVESSWPRVQIRDFRCGGGQPGEDLYLDIRNEDFTGELFVMGHGLQMWVQTMWFISRFPGEHTLILDEPDIYMHPDLQRKLCRYLFRKNRQYPQAIITTHSVEIMAEVEAEQILVLDRRKPTSVYANSYPTAQVVLDNIGSVHNVHLARLNWSRRFLVVEGEDSRILSVLHHTMFRESNLTLDAVPQTRTDGWGGWLIAIGAQQTISNNSGGTVKVYVIFDSDYHTEQEIKERYEQANKSHMNLHIWNQKEIENYLLNPSAIFRLIRRRATELVRLDVTEKQVRTQLDNVISEMREDVLDQIANENHKKFKSDVSVANKYARERIEHARQSQYGLASLVSGKKVIAEMSGWANDKFNVSFSPLAIAKEIYVDEIPDEMKRVLAAIETGDRL